MLNDHLGTVRVVTDDSGNVVNSMGYDGDWGVTHIAGHAFAPLSDSMATFWRYQGKEQDTFPLHKIGIEDAKLAAWLDELQLYHFHYREYAAGLAAFLSIDPAGQDSSPYMAFGGNPANAVDPDGGEWEPILLEFLFCAYWAVFWFWGTNYLVKDDINMKMAGVSIIAGGRQIARYGTEATRALMANVRTVGSGANRAVVVSVPEFYQPAVAERKTIASLGRNLGTAFVLELFENAIFLGASVTDYYDRDPAGANALAMVVIGAFYTLVATYDLQCCGNRGMAWKVTKAFQVNPDTKVENYMKERMYAFRAFDPAYKLSDSIGQGWSRWSWAAIEFGVVPDALSTSMAKLGGWVVRNLVGRMVTGSIDWANSNFQNSSPKSAERSALYFFDKTYHKGTLKTDAWMLQSYAQYGEGGLEELKANRVLTTLKAMKLMVDLPPAPQVANGNNGYNIQIQCACCCSTIVNNNNINPNPANDEMQELNVNNHNQDDIRDE